MMGAGAGPNPYTSSYDYGYYDDYSYDYYDYEYAEDEAAMVKTSSQSVSYDYYYDEVGGESVDISNIDFSDAMIIKTGYLEVQVDDTNEAVEEVGDIAQVYNGYVQSSYTYEDYSGQIIGEVTFRVPVDKFDSALDDVREFADYVSYESIDAEDVTETYMDLDARLGTFYELEEQYLAVLDSAYTVTDILLVYDYLQDVREEIESLESSMQYYESQSSYSTISVYMEEELSVFEGPEKWRPLNVVKEAFSDWIGFLQGLVDKAIWLVIYVWPLVIIWLVWRWRKRRK